MADKPWLSVLEREPAMFQEWFRVSKFDFVTSFHKHRVTDTID